MLTPTEWKWTNQVNHSRSSGDVNTQTFSGNSLCAVHSPHLEVHSLGISNLYATQLRQNTIHGSATMSISTAPESGTTIMPTRD